MLDGLCESLPAMRIVSAWRDAIREGLLALRHVINVEDTYGGERQHRHSHAGAEAAGYARKRGDGSDEGQPRLFAMEEAILSFVMEALDGIAASCPKLRRLQEKRIDLARKNRALTASQARRMREFERELSASMGSLRLTDARIEVLEDDLRNTSERLRRREGVVKHAILILRIVLEQPISTPIGGKLTRLTTIISPLISLLIN